MKIKSIRRLMMGTAVFAISAVLVNGMPLAQATPTPGVGYTHVNLIDGPGARNEEVQIDWFYPITDTTGLSSANFQFQDGSTNYGQHAMPGTVNGGTNKMTGPHPVIVFSHGTAGHGIQNYSMYRDLAAQGYLVAAVTHVRHSLVQVARYQQSGNNSAQELDNFTETAFNRHRDMKFAIDTTVALFSSTNKVLKDSSGDPYVYTMGHSQGGMTALTTATGLARNGSQDTFADTSSSFQYSGDTRIDGVIAISPSRYLTALAGWSDAEIQYLMASLSKPVLLISGRSDGITPNTFTDLIQKELTGTPFTNRLDVKDAEHNATTDLMALKPDVDSSTLPSDVKDLVTALYDQMCTGSTNYDCVNKMHGLQVPAVHDFIQRAMGQ